MRWIGCCFVLSFLAGVKLSAQAPSRWDDVIRVGPGVTPPRLLYKVEPEYSPDARADHVQGTVVLELFVDEKGRPADITLVSPLGYGLDERAQAAVGKWEFKPGMKDGKPVKIGAIVEVNFRFPGTWFDEKAERERTSFNVALQTLKRPNATAADIDRAVKSVQKLSHEHFPAAMYTVGTWEISDDHVTKDADDGLAQLQKAAAKYYGPALYEIAIRQIEGRDLPMNVEKGLEMTCQAAVLGSAQAQYYLGNRYEKGDGVPRELDRARRYFRLCATQGVPVCQYRLGRLLYSAEDRPERDYVQAVAWFQLAGENGIPEARDIASKEVANLTPEQTSRMTRLKAQLVRK